MEISLYTLGQVHAGGLKHHKATVTLMLFHDTESFYNKNIITITTICTSYRTDVHTYIALFCCRADADIEKFTRLEIWRGCPRLAGYIGTCYVSNEGLTLHLTNGKPLSIVISDMLLLSTSV